MELKFELSASGRSDEELLDIIENRQKYLPETIEASVAELQNREHEFSEAELLVINQDIQAHRDNAGIAYNRTGFFSNYKNNVVEDPDAPLFFSRRAIYGFAFFFGALFGSIMLAVNINKTKNPGNAIWVVFFGIGFTVLQVGIAELAKTGSAFGIITAILAAYILESFLWNRFIGVPTFYRVRPIWVPLAVAFVLVALVIAMIVMGGGVRV